MARPSTPRDKVYLDILLRSIRVCKAYRPKFGQGAPVTLEEFKKLYGSDPLYSWFGLDSPLLYAAHKASGGMTSLYRQVGMGLERVFCQLLQDQLGLNAEQVTWFYEIASEGVKKPRRLKLDGRIEVASIKDTNVRERVRSWLIAACKSVGVDEKVAASLKGCVFEVRQGYKSKDSKRQNADIGNAGSAYKNGYLPVALILSTQIDTDVAERYQGAGWLLLRGYEGGTALDSTYAFCRDVLGFDLGAFLKANSAELKESVNEVLEALLTPADTAPMGERGPDVDEGLTDED